MALQKVGRASQKRGDWGGILVWDGGGAEEPGHLRLEKQCKVEPADVRSKGPARVKGLCLVIEKVWFSQWEEVLREAGGPGVGTECTADSMVQTRGANTGS